MKKQSVSLNKIQLVCGCQSYFSKKSITEIFDDFKIEGSPIYSNSYTLGKITDKEDAGFNTNRTFTVCIKYSDLLDLLVKTTFLAQCFEYHQTKEYGDFCGFWIESITNNNSNTQLPNGTF
jgi:hypothetical protein